MAVVASFTHDGAILIPPSQLVTFADTSTGSPNKWIWDFGDGTTSNLQNPTHTFSGAAPTTFDVTLKTWLETTDTEVAPSNISGTARSTHKVVIGNVPPDQEAIFNASSSFTTLSTTKNYCGNMNDTNGGSTHRELRALRTQFAKTPTSNALKIPIIRVPLVNGESIYNRFPRGLEGTCILKRSEPGTWPGNFSTIASQGAVGIGRNIEFDISLWRGIPSWWMITSTEQAISADEGDVQERGFMGYQVLVRELGVSSVADIDESTQQLIFGVPPIADFVATPLAGPSPFSVQFFNTSTEAIGLPTTYSWKKRIHGSGDAFVEFSTQKDPTEIFSK